MNMVNTNKEQTKQSITKEKVINSITKVLLYAAGIVGGLVLLYGLYQIIEFIFGLAIVLIGFLGPVFPRRWR